ncbi:hypothetical protein HMPREF1333_00225 [Enterococcus faecalis ERV37]|nr:hypothetical protein HMPREF9515_01819 [Enterococcus faecalis TX0860]EGG51770.1 hypothetical protein HMPREF9520_03179 [Enterococcus faecalis TX1467]EJU99578.1 hypothetical protein HMPREF1330_01095 [Enterococcus faecalis ERV129]EJV11853.1 hypothetical protein HMPREF1333_00225 [Enterococcus faecalis ERV37]EJV12607.1 hypothetical protein HMPREF1334_00364 [Enterococcus faecalis ERV41]KDE15446.1 hypothetical protein HMPREF2097_03589 [Enterococcus faecalis 918]
MSRINRLNIHESSSFVLNDISYRLIIAQKTRNESVFIRFFIYF